MHGMHACMEMKGSVFRQWYWRNTLDAWTTATTVSLVVLEKYPLMSLRVLVNRVFRHCQWRNTLKNWSPKEFLNKPTPLEKKFVTFYIILPFLGAHMYFIAVTYQHLVFVLLLWFDHFLWWSCQFFEAIYWFGLFKNKIVYFLENAIFLNFNA